MLFDGIQLLDTSSASNFQIQSGSSLPSTGNNLGELFYVTGDALYVYDGSVYQKIGSSTPGGSTTYVQYNDGGLLGGSSSFTFNKSTGALTATSFQGNGSALTSIVTSLAGTSNQVSVSGSTGSITLSLPQNIGTSSTPTFSSVSVAADPTNPLQLATKQYVDNVANGLNVHNAVVTSSNGPMTATYNNGTSGVGATLTGSGTLPSIGGYAGLVLNDRVLIKDQADAKQNGIYVVSTITPNWVLTRAADFDNSPVGEVTAGDFVYIQEGTLAGTAWVQTTPDTIAVGTSNIAFTQFSGQQATTPAGSNSQIQFNSSGAFGASSALTFDTGTGTVSATHFSGDGAAVTGLSASNLASGTVGTARLGTGTASSSTFLRGDGSWAAVNANPGGSNTYVQFNDSGVFGGASSLTFNKTTGALAATSFSGIGSGLTSLNASNISSGTVGTSYLGSGTASSSTFLRGDNTWAAPTTITASGGLSFSTGTSASSIGVDGNGYASLALVNSGGGTDAKVFLMNAGNDSKLRFQFLNDGSTGSSTWMVATRSGATAADVTIAATTINLTGAVTGTSFSGSGASLTSLNASNISSGTVAVARLGTGTPSSSNFLRGDGSWSAVSNISLTNKQVAYGNSSNLSTSSAFLNFDATTNTLALGDGNSNPRAAYLRTPDVTGGTPSNGSPDLNLYAGNGSGGVGNSGNIYIRSGSASGTTDGSIIFSTGVAGTFTQRLQINPNGAWTVNGATGTNGQVLTSAGSGSTPTWTTLSGGGTVTSVSVTSANGFAGSVATNTTTPAITISTSITGLLKGNGTAISAATAGSDYLAPPSGTSLLKANSGGALANATAGTDYLAPFGSQTANTVYAAPNGSAGSPTFRALAAADLPSFSALSPITTKGDLIVGNGTNSATRLAVGTDTYVLTADSTQGTGLKWAAASGGASTSANNTWTAAQRGAVSSLSSASTITPSFDASNNFAVTLTSPTTIANPTGTITPGQSGVIVITQDATGSRTVAWGNYFVSAGGTKPTLSTTANAIDVISYYVISSTKIFIGASLAVA